jgi:hypothetical protein
MVTPESAGRLIVHDDVLIGNVERDQLSGVVDVVDVVQEGGEDGYFLNVKLCVPAKAVCGHARSARLSVQH